MKTISQFNLRLLDIKSTAELQSFNTRFIKPSSYGAGYMARKAGYYCIYAENIRVPAVHILKETMLSCGGEAVTPSSSLIDSEGTSCVVLMGSRQQFSYAVKRLRLQQFGLPLLASEISDLLEDADCHDEKVISFKKKSLPDMSLGKTTRIMAILNITPDSFSDGGLWDKPQKALDRALYLEEAGADIIDIGAESTRPGSLPISPEEEQQRLLPVLEKLSGNIKIPVSVDTYKAETAEIALKAGADIINDIWGFQYDGGAMASVCAAAGCPVILMHNSRTGIYENMLAEITAFLRHSVDIALEAGVSRENIILDPGFGFGKDSPQNLMLVSKLSELKSLGFPVLMAASRKRTVGEVLGAETGERIYGDAAVTAVSVMNGADIIRVHDVKELKQISMMADALKEAKY